MGWFKKLANKARQSNDSARYRSSGYSYLPEDSSDDEEKEIARVCGNCKYFSTTAFCAYYGTHVDQLDNQFDSATYGCEHFKYYE